MLSNPRTDAARRWKVAGIKLRAGGVFREFKRRDLTDIDTFVSRESEVSQYFVDCSNQHVAEGQPG